MRFGLDDDQRDLQASVRAFLESTSPLGTLISRLDAPHDEVVWKRIATELDLTGLAIPERHGGSGFSVFEVCAVLEEMGRVLYRGPYLSSAVLAAVTLLGAENSAESARLLPGLAAGTTIATCAVGLARSERSFEPLSADQRYGGWMVNGSVEGVFDLEVADVVIVFASTEDGLACLAVDLCADGVERIARAPMDLTRPLWAVGFRDAPAQVLATGASTSSLAQRVLDIAAVAQAAEQLGAARASLEQAIVYACQRQQFGRAIGSFQAIKHQLADVRVAVDAAHGTVLHAAWLASLPPAEGRALAAGASVAKASASDALYRAATTAAQVYGGVGFTWEHTSHLFVRRAVASRELFGSPAFHRRRVGDWLASGEVLPIASDRNA